MSNLSSDKTESMAFSTGNISHIQVLGQNRGNFLNSNRTHGIEAF